MLKKSPPEESERYHEIVLSAENADQEKEAEQPNSRETGGKEPGSVNGGICPGQKSNEAESGHKPLLLYRDRG